MALEAPKPEAWASILRQTPRGLATLQAKLMIFEGGLIALACLTGH